MVKASRPEAGVSSADAFYPFRHKNGCLCTRGVVESTLGVKYQEDGGSIPPGLPFIKSRMDIRDSAFCVLQEKGILEKQILPKQGHKTVNRDFI